MILQTKDILLCIASCTHQAMLCDLQAMKPNDQRDHENFDPNDEVLLRCFTIPALLDSLRSEHFDTGQGAKTDIVLEWSLGMHLDAEADKLTEEIFKGLISIYSALANERIAGWWRHVSEPYKEENRPGLQRQEAVLSSTLLQWRSRRSFAPVDSQA